jgi:hypothetical protein
VSNKIGSAYVVYEDLMNRGYVNLDSKKAAFKGILKALWGKWWKICIIYTGHTIRSCFLLKKS